MIQWGQQWTKSIWISIGNGPLLSSLLTESTLSLTSLPLFTPFIHAPTFLKMSLYSALSPGNHPHKWILAFIKSSFLDDFRAFFVQRKAFVDCFNVGTIYAHRNMSKNWKSRRKWSQMDKNRKHLSLASIDWSRQLVLGATNDVIKISDNIVNGQPLDQERHSWWSGAAVRDCLVDGVWKWMAIDKQHSWRYSMERSLNM